MFLFTTSMIHENTKPKPKFELDESLIKQIADKDTNAFHTLYELTNKSVYGFAYSILKDPQSAQDILQDTFVKIYTSASSYKPQGKPMAWILTITRNLALMKIRESKRTVLTDIEENSHMLPHISPNSDSEDKIILHNALTQLSDESRQIVVLHAVSGLKHREIAQVMNMKLPTVLSKYNRAIQKIQKILKEDS